MALKYDINLRPYENDSAGGVDIDVKAYLDQGNERDFLGVPEVILSQVISQKEKIRAAQIRNEGEGYRRSPMLDCTARKDETGFYFITLDGESIARVLSTAEILSSLDKLRAEASGYGEYTESLMKKLTDTIGREIAHIPLTVRDELGGLDEIVRRDEVTLGLPFRILSRAHNARVAALYRDCANWNYQAGEAEKLLDRLGDEVPGTEGVEKVKEAIRNEGRVLLNARSSSFRTAVAKMFSRNWDAEYRGVKSLRLLKFPEGAEIVPEFSPEKNSAINWSLRLQGPGGNTTYREVAEKIENGTL